MYCRLQFHKRHQLFIGRDDETLSASSAVMCGKLPKTFSAFSKVVGIRFPSGSEKLNSISGPRSVTKTRSLIEQQFAVARLCWDHRQKRALVRLQPLAVPGVPISIDAFPSRVTDLPRQWWIRNEGKSRLLGRYLVDIPESVVWCPNGCDDRRVETLRLVPRGPWYGLADRQLILSVSGIFYRYRTRVGRGNLILNSIYNDVW